MKNNVKIGNVTIGGKNPVRIQSMTNTDTKNASETIKQIKELEKAGCEIVRVSVYNEECAKKIPQIKSEINIPLIADIHFDYRLAILAIENGADKIRINPGNIGSFDRVKKIIDTAGKYNVPIRIGVNAGSLKKSYKKEFLNADYKKRAVILNEMLFSDVKLFEKEKFTNIVLSLKTSDVLTTIEAYRLADKNFIYPLHLGVTEAGGLLNGAIRSTAAFSVLLSENIGDTIRVSLAAEPVNEILVAKEILSVLGKKERVYEVIACPTCSRTTIDVIGLTEKIETLLQENIDKLKKKIKIAVMGCVVNGPGEAEDSDLGITGIKGEYYLFKKGKIIKKVKGNKIFIELKKEIFNC